MPGQVVDFKTHPVFLGQWDLSAGPFDSGAIRFVRLQHFLSILQPDLVAFEDVKYTPSEKVTRFNAGALLSRAATACELFGALKATVSSWCEHREIPCTSFGIGQIKKRATGKGNANKVDMINACNELFHTDFNTEDYHLTGADNIADAAHVLILLIEQYSKGI